MSYYSTAPVTAADAKTAGQRAALTGKWLLVVALMAGFVGVIALFFLIDDPSASPAWITLLICVAICTVFGSLTRMVNKRLRYRITVSFSPLRLVGAYVVFGVILAAVIGTFSALDVDEGPASVVVHPLFMVGTIGIVVWHMAKSTLFQATWMTLIMRGTTVGWDEVEAVVLTTGSAHGTVELGVMPRPGGQTPTLDVRPGERLVDIPMRVVVPASKVDVDKLHWAINQTGRTDMLLIERTAGGDRVLRQSNTRGAGCCW